MVEDLSRDLIFSDAVLRCERCKIGRIERQVATGEPWVGAHKGHNLAHQFDGLGRRGSLPRPGRWF